MIGARDCKVMEVLGSCGGYSAIPAAEGGCRALEGDCKALEDGCKALAAMIMCGCIEVSTTKP
ncbi:unnamed protein product [Prunus armeniaca]